MHYFTNTELNALLSVAYTRNRLHHGCMLASVCHGLRVSEAIALTAGDYQGEFVVCRRLKGNKKQFQPVHIADNPVFDERLIAGMANDFRLTPTRRLFPFSRQRCDQFIRVYGTIASIPMAKLHWHTFKHTTAMLVWNASHSLSQVQQVIGHKAGSASTLVYLYESEQAKGIESLRVALNTLG